ncbi:MAG: hypothetical protein Q7J32_12525 [Sphingomonadaceae bacterium]|nr:hypothetical protein [Sphingomonadaceae bacterium]
MTAGVEIDEIARERAISRYGLDPCLHVPIAAVDEHALTTYVGTILSTLSGRGARKAFLIEAHDAPAIDPSFPICHHAAAAILRQPLQAWVHVAFGSYRAAYRRGFPDQPLGDAVLSHAMNRRVAALKGFDFVRVTPTSRRANSSSAFSERWGVAQYSSSAQPPMDRREGAFIAYADLTELLLMLDIRLGGGVMDMVNEGQRLVRPG